MTAATFINMVNSFDDEEIKNGFLGEPGMISFGRFSQMSTASYNVYEIVFFVLMGCMGGLIGALFNHTNTVITQLRLKFVNKYPMRRFIEVLLVTLLVSDCSSTVPYIINDCRDIASKSSLQDIDFHTDHPFYPNNTVYPPYSDHYACAHVDCKCEAELRGRLLQYQGNIYTQDYDGSTYPTLLGVKYMSDIDCILQESLKESLVQFTCEDGQYSPAASILFTTGDRAIKMLLHNKDKLSVQTLFVIFVVYWLLACVTYGIGVPSGLFVPALLTGSIYGRMCGEILNDAGMLGDHVDRSRVCVYALIGASAMLSGMARITISLTVILLECTNDVQYCLPIMVTVMFAKWVGDIFNEGLYDIHIHLKHVPFLEPYPEGEMDAIRACDVMNKRVETLPVIAQVSKLIETLRETDYSSFPVLKEEITDVPNRYLGIMRRDYLCEILSWRNFDGSPKIFQERKSDKRPPMEDWATIQNKFGNYPNIEDAIQDLQPDQLEQWVNLEPYINRNAYTLQETALVTRAYTLFRSMGLRALPILGDGGSVVGMITRQDLLHGSIHKGKAIAEASRPEEFKGSMFKGGHDHHDDSGEVEMAGLESDNAELDTSRMQMDGPLEPDTP
jgi:CBS domain-containing protein